MRDSSIPVGEGTVQDGPRGPRAGVALTLGCLYQFSTSWYLRGKLDRWDPRKANFPLCLSPFQLEQQGWKAQYGWLLPSWNLLLIFQVCGNFRMVHHLQAHKPPRAENREWHLNTSHCIFKVSQHFRVSGALFIIKKKKKNPKRLLLQNGNHYTFYSLLEEMGNN